MSIRVNNQYKNKYIKMLVSGINGCGKSTLVKTLPKDSKILYINFEEGIDSIANWYNNNRDRVDILSVENFIEDVQNLSKYNLQYIIDGAKIKAQNESLEEKMPLPNITDYQDTQAVNYDFVFVDSVTALGKKIEYQIKQSKLKPTYDDWNIIQGVASNLFYTLLKLNTHVIFLGHTTIENNVIGLRLNGTVFKGNILDDVNYSFYYYVSPEGRGLISCNEIAVSQGILNMCKTSDELGVLNKIEEPNLEAIINKLTKKDINEINMNLLKSLFNEKIIKREDFIKYNPELKDKKPTWEELLELANTNNELKEFIINKIN